jgi:hypothetical protein
MLGGCYFSKLDRKVRFQALMCSVCPWNPTFSKISYSKSSYTPLFWGASAWEMNFSIVTDIYPYCSVLE